MKVIDVNQLKLSKEFLKLEAIHRMRETEKVIPKTLIHKYYFGSSLVDFYNSNIEMISIKRD